MGQMLSMRPSRCSERTSFTGLRMNAAHDAAAAAAADDAAADDDDDDDDNGDDEYD